MAISLQEGEIHPDASCGPRVDDVREISLVRQTTVQAVRLLVLILLSVLVIRTWFVLGLVEPVTVSGSSMAPVYRGPFVTAVCPRCDEPLTVGAEFAARTYFTDCSHCGEARVSLDGLPLESGDVLWIDRTAFVQRAPRRGEPVVFLSPAEAGQLIVKRVAGLPGEHVTLREGDLWINGTRMAKSLVEQRELRQAVHREREPVLRWQSASAAWKWHSGRWQYAATSDDESRVDLDWLEYQHPLATFTDDAAYNAGLTQQLAQVNDLCFSVAVRLETPARLTLRLNDGLHKEEIVIDAVQGKVRAVGLNLTREIPPSVVRRLRTVGVLWEVSTFDRQLLVALDGVTLILHPLTQGVASSDAKRTFAVGVGEGTVVLENLTIYRDIHYLARNSSSQPLMGEVRLGPHDYFLLGDNVPVSVDSRHWGGLPEHLLIGKPFRFPLRSEASTP